ncbi:unnamed protein product [Ectocarpus sp. 12 AP-2014]
MSSIFRNPVLCRGLVFSVSPTRRTLLHPGLRVLGLLGNTCDRYSPCFPSVGLVWNPHPPRTKKLGQMCGKLLRFFLTVEAIMAKSDLRFEKSTKLLREKSQFIAAIRLSFCPEEDVCSTKGSWRLLKRTFFECFHPFTCFGQHHARMGAAAHLTPPTHARGRS